MGQYTTFIWLAVMIALFYFMLIRPQKKKEKADRVLRNNIKAGDLIVTIGGFTGRVLSIKDDIITFETGADRTKLAIKKWAIQSRESGTEDDGVKELTNKEAKEKEKKEAREEKEAKEENTAE